MQERMIYFTCNVAHRYTEIKAIKQQREGNLTTKIRTASGRVILPCVDEEGGGHHLVRRVGHFKLTEFNNHPPPQVDSENARAQEEVNLARICRVEECKGRYAPWQHCFQVALVGPDVGQAHAALRDPFPG